MHSFPPTFLLIRPQLGENIGAAARAMSNFGLHELRLVAPRDGWPNRKAEEMAAGGLGIIEKAAIFSDIPAALSDRHMAYATTGRMRDVDKRVISPEEAMAEMRAHMGQGRRTALLFGPERTGLANEDLALVDALVAIPTHPANPSLNLAQSVVVMAYEWFKATGGTFAPPEGRHAAAPPEEGLRPASKEEWAGFFAQLEDMLENSGHFRTPQKKPIMWQNLQNIFLRAPLSSQEVRTLRGMLRSLARRTGEGE